jgi:hypothetical protein
MPHDVCLLFLHHKSDDLTRHNLASIRHHNPDVPVVPIHCRDGNPCDPLPDSIEVPCTFKRGANWQSADAIIYEWFRGPHVVQAERYIVLEWDTHATQHVRECYKDVWDKDAAGVNVMLRGRDSYSWFDTQTQFLPRDWWPHVAALSPLCGVMLSHRALADLAAEPLVDGVYCEVRIGTMLHWCGYPLTSLAERGRTLEWIPSSQSRVIDPVPGIYHPVRTLSPQQLSEPPSSASVCVLPYYGEFGWMVARHVRWVHQLVCSHKVVCCRRGEEYLYPTADAYHYDWPEALPDAERCEDGEGDDTIVRASLRTLYPNHLLIRPHYPNPWAWDHAASVKFVPVVPHELPPVDVALCPRRRNHGTEKNWPHWMAVADAIRAAGFTVGLVGQEATSYAETPADVRAWQHPDGETAGTVDLLTHSSIYVGGDTGVSHLCALADVPTILFAPPHHYHGWSFTGHMRRANRAHFDQLGETAWSNPSEVVGAVLDYMTAKKYKKVS